MTPIFILRILNVITSVQNFCLLSYSKLMYPWHTAHFVRDQLSFSPELQCNVGCCFLCSALPRRTTRIQQPCLCWGSSALPSLLEADQISYQTVLCRAKVRSLLWSPSCNSAQTLGDGLLWIAFLPLLWVIPDIYGGCLLTTSASFFPNLSVLVWILRILSPGLPFPVLLSCQWYRSDFLLSFFSYLAFHSVFFLSSCSSFHSPHFMKIHLSVTFKDSVWEVSGAVADCVRQ